VSEYASRLRGKSTCMLASNNKAPKWCEEALNDDLNRNLRISVILASERVSGRHGRERQDANVRVHFGRFKGTNPKSQEWTAFGL
jgi:hypothetical protein